MAATILYLWMVVATDRINTYHGWVNVGEFSTNQRCLEAASKLGIKDQSFRCITK